MILPLHVVLIEMVVDPICSIAFENQPESSGLMQRGPRPSNEALIGWRQLVLGLSYGLAIFAACFALYVWANQTGLGENMARTLAFVALTVANLMMVRIFASSGFALTGIFGPGQMAFWIITAVVTLIVAACIEIPTLATIFGFANPGALALIAVVIGTIALMLLLDTAKRLPLVKRTLMVAAKNVQT